MSETKHTPEQWFIVSDAAGKPKPSDGYFDNFSVYCICTNTSGR
jgi:hypothetical protein